MSDTEETPKVPKKQCSPALGWIFTWNNYPDDWKKILVPKFQNSDNVKGYIAGKEVAPTTGTPHIQGYMEFKTKARPMGLLPKQVSWRCARGKMSHNYNYCSKDGDFISWGSVQYVPPYSINIKLRPWQIKIYNILLTEPNDRDMYWFWEHNGCAGKTTFQKWIYLNPNMKDVVVLSGKATDMKNGVIEYEEKHKTLPKIVLINIPRCQDTDHVSWQGIEEIKDMFFFSPKYHGGQVCGPNPHVIIFSNEPAPTWKMSPDRWHVYEIEEEDEPEPKRQKTDSLV